MSWRDREYARREASFGGFRPRRRGLPIIGGSVVTTLIVVNIAVYLIANLIPSVGQWFYALGVLQGRAVLHGQLWRLVTVQYLHDPNSVWHLAFNMIGLHFLGRPLEQRWSARRFFGIYTMCGIAGSLFFTLLVAQQVIDPRQVAVGASACIYGLLGIVAVLFPTQIVYVQFLFPMRIRTVAYVLGGIAFLTVIIRGSNYGGEACHLAGLVFGVWWAAKGERWWQTTEWRWPHLRTSKRTAPVRPPSATSSAAIPKDAEIDRILRKVYDGGLHTLSEAEKEALRAVTEQKQRDTHSERFDRL